MRWPRSRTMTASRVGASISPRNVSPRGEMPSQRNVAMSSSPGRWLAPRGRRGAAQHGLELLRLRGVAHGLLVGDQSPLEQIEQRLAHGLHAVLRLADLHLRVDLVDLLLAHEVPDR